MSSLAGVGVAPAATTGSISGTVTAVEGGPLAGACVNVFAPGAGEQGSTQTDAAGRYLVNGLASGSYKVLFHGCDNVEYLPEWYDNAPDEASATLVVVQDAAETSGVDAALAVGGSVSGLVTDESGTPLAGECVSVGNSTTGHGVNTNADGTYRIPGLPSGSYTAQFGCHTPGNYLMEWYDNKPSPFTADPVIVVEGSETSGIDAALTAAGHITGTVTDETGAPIYAVCVTAYGPLDYYQVATAETGEYYIDQLPAGDYRMFFEDCVHITHASEWYDDKPNIAAADPVAVVGGQTTSGVDIELASTTPTSGFIFGNVTDLVGDPLAGICVEVRKPFGTVLGVWTTNDAGDYQAGAFVPGGYKVLFRDCVPGGATTAEWYDDKPTFAQANQIEVPIAGNAQADASLLTCSTGPDSDGDGVTDCDESKAGTDPSDPDSDGDLFSDGFEEHGGTCLALPLEGGSDPVNALSNPLVTLPVPPLRLPTPLDPVCN